jgi:hypothetical protein
VKFVESMKKLSVDYLASSYPAWLKEYGWTDTAKTRSIYAALGTIVQQFNSIDKATVGSLFADSETVQPSTPKTLGTDIETLFGTLLYTKNAYPSLARDAQVCLTKLEDISYRYQVMMKPTIEKNS